MARRKSAKRSRVAKACYRKHGISKAGAKCIAAGMKKGSKAPTKRRAKRTKRPGYKCKGCRKVRRGK
jgi:hypothetical protein